MDTQRSALDTAQKQLTDAYNTLNAMDKEGLHTWPTYITSVVQKIAAILRTAIVRPTDSEQTTLNLSQTVRDQ